MNPGGAVRGLRATLAGQPTQRWALRLVAPAGTGAFVALTVAAGSGEHAVLWFAAAVLALLAAVLPAGSAPLFLLLYLAGLWALTVPRTLGGEVLLAALDLVVVHLAATLAALGPPQLRLTRPVLARWAARGAAMAAAAAAMWLLARLLTGSGEPVAWLTGAALAAVVAWTAVLLRRLTRPS